MKKTFKKLAVMLSLASLGGVGATTLAYSAQDTASGQLSGQHRHWKHMKAVFQACAQSNSITLPPKGSGEQLSAENRETIHACVQQFRTNFESCAQSAGIPKPQPGERPSLTSAEKASLKQCRTESIAQIAAVSPASN
jgi:hypothetical protein